MKPAARIAAAIEVLDSWLAGQRADAALKAWGRAHRFAGSGDRAAIRTYVFQAIRCRRSYAALGGADTGRGLMLGSLRAQGIDPTEVFGAGPHSPAPLSGAETAAPAPPTGAVSVDCPDWLWPGLQADLGGAAAETMARQRDRAPVFLRVNQRRSNREDVAERLRAEGIVTRPHPKVNCALEAIEKWRRVSASAAYSDGLIELQDAHSQAVVADLAIDLPTDARVLDYCAGAGGKSLALAEIFDGPVLAHDIAPDRMRDLPSRAARAGAKVQLCPPQDLQAAGAFDLVLCDAPCSGSGTWRRDPEGKWALTPERLSDLQEMQKNVITKAAQLLRPGGRLVYVTCSILTAENEAQAAWARRDVHGIDFIEDNRWPVGPEGDGFYRAIFLRS